MKIIRELNNIKNTFSYPVLTLGNFDGVHMGHQAIFNKVVARARENQGTSIVFTFKDHTLKVLAPERVPPKLTTFEKKMELIEKCGIDVVICIDFTREIANLSHTQFLSDVIIDKIGARELIVDYDCAFGKGGKGSVDFLRDMETVFGYKLEVVSPVRNNGDIVSSTLIRNILQEGSVEKSIDLLGRNYSLRGTVIDVVRKGKSTDQLIADIDSGEDMILPAGTYLGTVKDNNFIYTGFIHLNCKPALNGNRATIEIHISHDFRRQNAGKNISINLAQRIPDSVRYNVMFSNPVEDHEIIQGYCRMRTY